MTDGSIGERRYNPFELCNACAVAARSAPQEPAVVPREIGQRLKRLRRGRELTQEELAGKAGVSLSIITKLEAGYRDTPGIGTLAVLADALGVDVAAFFPQPPRPVRIPACGSGSWAADPEGELRAEHHALQVAFRALARDR